MSRQHIAALFPGQGVLDTDVLRHSQAASPDAVARFAQLDEAARGDLTIFLASIASYRALLQRGVRPRALVGHGFGEIGALVAAGALSLDDGAEIVARRYLALAATKTRNRMAVLKLPAAHVHTFLRVLNEPSVSIAAENAPEHTVIVGSPTAIGAAEALARLLGLSFERLTTTWGPHRAGLGGIEQQLVDSLRHITRSAPHTAVYSPLLGRFYRAEDDVVACVAQQLVQPLRFADAVKDLVAGGITLFVEVGPLRGLRRTLACRAVADTQVRSRSLPTQLEVA